MAESMILERLEGVRIRFEEVAQLITDPSVIADVKRYIQLNKEYKNLEPIAEAHKKYKQIISNIADARAILEVEKDPRITSYNVCYTKLLRLVRIPERGIRRRKSGSRNN